MKNLPGKKLSKEELRGIRGGGRAGTQNEPCVCWPVRSCDGPIDSSVTCPQGGHFVCCFNHGRH